MNNAQHVAALFSSQAEMARVINRNPGRVTRMLQAGRIPGSFNAVLMQWAVENGVSDKMEPLLTPVCACCGAELK